MRSGATTRSTSPSSRRFRRHPKQVREWETAGLLPAGWVDGRRQFFFAAVVHAFALRQLSRFQIAALANLMAAEHDDDVFIQASSSTRSPLVGSALRPD